VVLAKLPLHAANGTTLQMVESEMSQPAPVQRVQRSAMREGEGFRIMWAGPVLRPFSLAGVAALSAGPLGRQSCADGWEDMTLEAPVEALIEAPGGSQLNR
jgi:hypothetical protein